MNESMTPLEGEYAAFYAGYIAQVKDMGIPQLLLSQIGTVRKYFESVGEEKSQTAYAAGKWTQKEVLGHIIDTDRIMTFRALCIARGEQASLPGYDQDAYVANANFNQIPLSNLLEDFEISRYAMVSMLKSLPKESLAFLGKANGYNVSVRALFNIIPGHTQHHLNILKERYV